MKNSNESQFTLKNLRDYRSCVKKFLWQRLHLFHYFCVNWEKMFIKQQICGLLSRKISTATGAIGGDVVLAHERWKQDYTVRSAKVLQEVRRLGFTFCLVMHGLNCSSVDVDELRPVLVCHCNDVFIPPFLYSLLPCEELLLEIYLYLNAMYIRISGKVYGLLEPTGPPRLALQHRHLSVPSRFDEILSRNHGCLSSGNECTIDSKTCSWSITMGLAVRPFFKPQNWKPFVQKHCLRGWME